MFQNMCARKYKIIFMMITNNKKIKDIYTSL